MKSYVKPFIKQLTIAAIFLSVVTILSIGIRHIRFSLYRANTLESPVVSDTEPNTDPADSQTADVQSEPEYTDASDGIIENESEPQQSTAPVSVKMKSSKSKSSKSLEKISLSDYENLYITKEGQLWYVNEEPDGKTVKMQVRIDDTTGKISVIDAKSGGPQNLQKISLSDYENLYITPGGEQWYVSEESDGSVTKSQVQIDDTTGEITVISNENYAKSDNSKERETKD